MSNDDTKREQLMKLHRDGLKANPLPSIDASEAAIEQFFGRVGPIIDNYQPSGAVEGYPGQRNEKKKE